ncbi:hypothetical protein CC1G_13036 [Coprinopsis cinerea okayama7|uniref:Uncharacterized protein n=1 Tax=Coprinopsis cinerea (strain Okayama-7 / 130 / ATCC MYA-4618 / FGSC 9003) TaxID=240176 RepID=A8P3Q6_COPC7|nr:hypothetical protein CC1G_13036 [Coprinopsis cinerea okayama7\|eukprot:XP_001838593.1 hypothetical protein CC1G_13036 [Coprinopsis cinerea okayama7\
MATIPLAQVGLNVAAANAEIPPNNSQDTVAMDDATHTDVPIDVDPDSASRCHLYTGAFVDVIEGTREGIFKCGGCRVRNKVVVGKMEALYVVTRGDGCVGIFKNYAAAEKAAKKTPFKKVYHIQDAVELLMAALDDEETLRKLFGTQ